MKTSTCFRLFYVFLGLNLAAICVSTANAQQTNAGCVPNPCGTGAQCTQTAVGYNCACTDSVNQWYDYATNTCQDVNECMANPCPREATCKDMQPGFTCTCPTGYQWFYNASMSTCYDIDECRRGTHNCYGSSNCTNLIGSFYCACKKGFYYNGADCVDANECAASPPPCGGMSRCNNTVGGYNCYCPVTTGGYVYNSYINDCLILPPLCASNPCGKPPNTCTPKNTTTGHPYICSCTNGSISIVNSTRYQTCYNANITSSVGLITNTTNATQPRLSLDIMWNNRFEQNNVWQWGYDGNTAQQFNLVSAGNGYYWIKDSSKLWCFATYKNNTASGTDVVIQTCDSVTDNQRWLFNRHPVTLDLFQISLRLAPTQCITITDDVATAGAIAELQPCIRNSRGQWYRIVRQ